MFRAHAGAGGGKTVSPGMLVSERLGDYVYRLSEKSDLNLGGFGFNPGAVPDVAKELLEPYVSYCRLLL